jgi:SNF2 family DNA or RNA helicase
MESTRRSSRRLSDPVQHGKETKDPVSPPKHNTRKRKTADITASVTKKEVDDETEVMDLVSSGEDNEKSTSLGKFGSEAHRSSIPMHEVERAAVDRLNNLSRFRTIFEPFITAKVMQQLNNVLIAKQAAAASCGTAAAKLREEDHEYTPQLLTQPYCLSPICKMRGYQLEGFSWLVNNYYRSINCILADEMGLGKTLQSIACVAHLAIVKKLSGPYLFIVPLSVLFNWMNEFKKWCPQLKVVRLHSLDKEDQLRLRKTLLDPNAAQIVVTTYDTVKTGGLSGALRKHVWRCVFLDEGHRIKNENSDVARACHGLRTRFRVVLTGTPVQNNLHEFGALLHFLAPNIFTNLELFDSAFNLKVTNGALLRSPKKHIHREADTTTAATGETQDGNQDKSQQQIDRALLNNAHYMMKPFVLRRLKSEVEQKLPPKYETKINCPMTELQKEVTRALLFKEQALLNRLDGERVLHVCECASVLVELIFFFSYQLCLRYLCVW